MHGRIRCWRQPRPLPSCAFCSARRPLAVHAPIQLAAATPDTSGFVVDLDLESGSDLRLKVIRPTLSGTVNLNNVVIGEEPV